MNDLANILVVDDDQGMLDTLVGVIEEQGLRVFPCQNGTEALQYLMTNLDDMPIDLVIADLKMPDMNGLQILWAMKKADLDLAFILITGHASMETAIEAVNQGAFAYHVKPLDIDAFITSVRNALRQRHLLIENRRLLEGLQQSNHEMEIANADLQAIASELHRSETKYRALVEQAGDAIFIVEPHSGHFIEVNSSMEASTGYSRQELLGKSFLA